MRILSIDQPQRGVELEDEELAGAALLFLYGKGFLATPRSAVRIRVVDHAGRDVPDARVRILVDLEPGGQIVTTNGSIVVDRASKSDGCSPSGNAALHPIDRLVDLAVQIEETADVDLAARVLSWSAEIRSVLPLVSADDYDPDHADLWCALARISDSRSFRVRVHNALVNANIRTPEELKRRSASDLLANVKNLGSASVHALARAGLIESSPAWARGGKE